MSDNFLSFLGKVGQSGTDNSSEKPAMAIEKSTKNVDFKEIFHQETSDSKALDSESADSEGKAEAFKFNQFESTLEADSESTLAPVAVLNSTDNGNSLPKLSIHSRGLEIGRVILTTASPKVSEDSLSAFARAQGIDDALLKADSSKAAIAMAAVSGRPKPHLGVAKNTPSVLSELLHSSSVKKNIANSALSPILNKQPTASATTDKSVLPGNVSTAQIYPPVIGSQIDLTAAGKEALAALRAQQAFASPKGSVEVTAARDLVDTSARSIMGASDLSSSLRQASIDVASINRPKHSADQNSEGSDRVIEAKILSEKMSISELRQARQAFDSAMELASSNVQNGLESRAKANNTEPGAGASSPLLTPPVGAQQAPSLPATAGPANLAFVLSANDPALTQARMQPYQDWALKFGEVLGRKLALAVNQGTWAVRLNLNPQTLGEIVVSLEVGERGLEGQLSSNDSAVRQLLSDALPKLRSSLEALLDQRGNVNILVDQEDSSKGKKPSRDMLEEFIDLEDEIFSGSEAIPGSGNMLWDGFDALV
jgi:flagellar hook-length control protein FliK